MNSHKQKLTMVAVSIGLLLLAITYNKFQITKIQRQPLPIKSTEIIAADVAVIATTTREYSPLLRAYGEAVARYELILTAQVAGEVKSIADGLASGKLVNKGQALAVLDHIDYTAAVARAEASLAEARLRFLEIEREAEQARLEWQNSGLEGAPTSSLVLKEPQLEHAKTSVKEAQKNVKKAQRDLSRTRVEAPFDGVVVNRSISMGSFVQPGSEIATLYSTDRVEISLPLAQREWALLPNWKVLAEKRWPVTLIAEETGQVWQAYILRQERHVDIGSRQQSLIVGLDKPFEQLPVLYPGTFVRAELKAKAMTGLWKLPPSSLSQKGEVWFVSNGRLERFSAESIASDEDAIYIRPPAKLVGELVNVLINPLSSYIPGMAVNPVGKANE